jgi:hypothetical protein
MTPRERTSRADFSPTIRMVLDDRTVERLRVAAEGRHLEVEQLIVRLITAAADRIDELLADGEQRNSENG